MCDAKNPLGVKVVDHYPWDDPPDACCIIEMPDENVADSLSEAFKQWCYGQPVMITAPTGSGKTTLVIKIAGYCHKRTPDKWVLLLVSRKAIAIQQMQIFASKLGSKWAKIADPEVFELFEVLDDIHVIIATYQGFAAHHDKFPLDKVDWVIFDEAHVFHADSLFNPQLDQLFWKLPNMFSHAHRLYLTATPDSIIHDICAAEEQNLTECASCHHWHCHGKGKLRFYKFPAHYQHINLRYFRERSEVIELVKQNPAEQFLLFTSNKEDLENPKKTAYSKQFSEAGISWGYLDSERKGTALWKRICKDGTFDGQVLIATSVLDCGVNLKGSRLRHIVVESTDQMEFLQMIGRRRLEKQDNLTVYIKAYSREAIVNRLSSTEKALGFISNAYTMIHNGNSDALLYRGWMDESKQRPYMHSLNYLGNGAVLPKLTTKHYLRWQQMHLERLLELYDLYGDDSALPRMVHQWLGQSDAYSPDRWLDYDQKLNAKAKLFALLEDHINTIFTKDDFQSFSKDVLELVNRLQVFAHDNSDKTNRKADTVNKRLRYLHIPYEFHKNGQGKAATYTLARTEGRCEQQLL